MCRDGASLDCEPVIAASPLLSVLDLTPVPEGHGSAEALANSIELARHAEQLGYHRVWLAEHHNTAGLASSAPEVLIATIAAATDHIRVGAGGVMLPNHVPLRVAETYRVLEALHPGRIDLALGRAPGTDGLTAAILRRATHGATGDDFALQVAELQAFGGAGFPSDHPYRPVQAQPDDITLPPLWMLGSSEYGGQAAAALGVGLAFARYLNPRGAAAITRDYRDRFQPPSGGGGPRVILAVSAICADSSERADELAWSGALSLIRMRSGRPAPVPRPERARQHPYTEAQRDQIRRYLRAQVLGDPESVATQLRGLAAESGADELMVMTTVHDHAERLRSYRLIAEAMAANAPQ